MEKEGREGGNNGGNNGERKEGGRKGEKERITVLSQALLTCLSTQHGN